MPNLFIIGGCNGAGKTTASFTLLPEILNCKEFVNADEIAKGLSPFQPETVSFEAGRIMLTRIKELLNQKKDFAFETTLSTKSYHILLKKAKQEGYLITLIYFWLETTELAEKRVQLRVENGGHGIPNSVIVRRYHRGLQNLFSFYLRLVDNWLIYDNSLSQSELIAQGKGNEILVFNHDIWNRLYEREL